MILKKYIRFLWEDSGSLKAKTFRSGFWVTSASMFVRSLEFVRSIILARLLTPEMFGIMAIISLIFQGFETFTQTGFRSAIIQRKNVNKNLTDTAWVVSISRGVVLAGLLFVASPYIADFYNQPELCIFLKAMSFGFLLDGFSNTNMVLYQKELDFKLIAFSQNLVSLTNFIVVVVLAYYLRSVWALIIGQLVVYFSRMLFSYLMQPNRPFFRFDIESAKDLISYGKFLTGGAIVVFITLQIDNAVIGKFLGMEALGYYALAYTLANLPATHITQIISSVMFPAYSKLQDDRNKLNQTYIQTVQAVTTLTIPAAAGIALLAPEIISTLYGEQWGAAVPALQVLCVFGLIRSIGATTGPLLNATNNPHIPFYLNSIKLTIIALIIYPLTIKFGIIGTASSIVFPSIFMQFVIWITIFRVTKLNLIVLLRVISYPVIGSVFMALIVYAIKGINTTPSNSTSKLIIYVMSGFISYCLSQLVLQKSFFELFFKKGRQNR